MKSQRANNGLAPRRVGTRGPPRQSFLIFCEGEATEPLYFKAFQLPSVRIEVLGLGMNTDSLVREALRRRALEEPYDQSWCVFDRDSFKPDQFNRAIQLAEENGLKVAWSNECFELWYLLHFNYLDSAVSRSLFPSKLKGHLGRSYEKNSQFLYEVLKPRQQEAIRNARRLHEQYRPSNPEKDNPCTTVYLLVEQLNRFQ